MNQGNCKVFIDSKLLSATLTRHYLQELLEKTVTVARGAPVKKVYKISVFVRYMDPPQAEFLAENQVISIRPNFSENKICLISVSLYVSIICICIYAVGRLRAI